MNFFSAARQPSVEFYSFIKAIKYVTTLFFVDSFMYLFIQLTAVVRLLYVEHCVRLGDGGMGERPLRGKKDPSPKGPVNQLKEPMEGAGEWPCQTCSLEKLLWLLARAWGIDYYCSLHYT